MKLSKYMQKHSITYEKMASKAGLGTMTLFKMFRGTGITLETAMKIYYGTEQQVTPQELYEELEEIKVAKAKEVLASANRIKQHHKPNKNRDQTDE